MSKHRVKAVAATYDDYDDYDDDYEEDTNDGLTAEDRAQLAAGMVAVRAELNGFPASDKEIVDSLWHYYYDVAKTVAYLKNKQAAATPKAKKKDTPTGKLFHDESTFFYCKHRTLLRQPASALNFEQVILIVCSQSAIATQHLGPFDVRSFFDDTPWLRIPSSRRAHIFCEPSIQSRGLLGGSASGEKMSKLAALAAKRRQKENARPAQAEQNNAAVTDDYASSLKALRLSSAAPFRNKTADIAAENQAATNTQQAAVDPEGQPESTATNLNKTEVLYDPKQLTARPSAFANAMLGTSQQSQPLNVAPAVEKSASGSRVHTFDFSTPSPDDVVARSQATKVNSATNSATKEPRKPKGDLSNGVNKLSIQEPPKIKSKNVDVLTEYGKTKRKNAANFVVIGHVDAGKSTLMGRLLFDLEAVDQRTMERYKREAETMGKGSFAFAWVLDQGSEERARGVTIDIATNNFETEKTKFTILDAPGHRDFVPNMIAGASQADFAVLVIDASTGNFESGLKGQTKEHALLARSIGVQKMIVAVNKMDAADWSQDRFADIQQQMSGFLTTAGFQSKNVSFVPCSGLQGDNILHKSKDERSSWYTGSSLVEELDKAEPNTHAIDKPLRMTIGDVFRGGVQNPLSASGRLEAGTVQTGEQIVIMPSGETANIKSLEVDDEPQEWAVAGQNVVLNLTEIDPIHLKTGDVLCSTASPIKNVTQFTAKVLTFDHLTPMNVNIHRGRLDIPGRISRLVATLDKASGAVIKAKPKIVQPGSVVRVVITLEQAVPLEAASRVVLRNGGDTVGAALIE